MANSLHFRDVDFADYGVTVVRGGLPFAPPVQIATQEIGRRDGTIAPPSTYGARTIDVSCVVRGTSASDLRSKLDSVASVVAGREDGVLWFDHTSDRYWMARLSSGGCDPSSPTHAMLDLTFVASDPHAYAMQESVEEVTITADPVSASLTAGGTDRAYPVVEIALGVQATRLVLEHEGTGDRVEWHGVVAAGGRLRFNCDPNYVLVEAMVVGADTWSPSMRDVAGRFPFLRPGEANHLRLYGMSSGTLTIRWRDRYL